MKKIFKGLGLGFMALAFSLSLATPAGAVVTFSNLAVDTAAADAFVLGATNTTGSITIGSATHTGATTISSGTITGTTTTSALPILADAVTTGTAVYLTADALTTGEGMLLDHTTSVIADGGSLLRLSSSSVDTGGATNGTILDVQSTGQLAGTVARFDNILTTGTGVSIIGTGIMTTTGNLLTLTGNSATTAAGLLRVNGNGLTSGIGAVITSSSTGLTGAGRLLRVDHTGAAGETGIVAEIASAAADETEILQVTASAALAGGKVVDLTASALTTGNVLDITYTGTTGSAINITDSTGADANSMIDLNQTTADVTAQTYLIRGSYTDDGQALADFLLFEDAASTAKFSVSAEGATVIAGVAEGTAALTLTAGDVVITDGDLTVTAGDATFNEDVTITAGGSIVSSVANLTVPFMPAVVQQALSGAGAVNITTFYTAWTTTAADAGTLADSTVTGQLKKVQLIVDGGDGTLTIAQGGAADDTIVFADAGDYALLMWNGTAWVPVELGNDADGATAPVYTNN